jgi:hypothetical protein
VLQSLTLELDQVSSQVADYKGELNELDGLLMRKKTELSCCEMDIETLKVVTQDCFRKVKAAN